MHEHQPEEGDQQGDPDDRRHKDAGDRIRQLCDRCLGRSCVTHHPDDLGKRAVFADPGRLTAQKTGLVQGRRGDLVPGIFVHRNTLSGEGRLVDRTAPFQDDPVYGDVFSGPDDKNIALSHVIDPDLLLPAVPDDVCRPGCQLHEALEGIGRAPLGAGLQHLSDRDQGQDHGCGFKVEFHHVVHDGRTVPVHLGPGHGKKHGRAVDKGRAGSQRDQGIHIGGAVE